MDEAIVGALVARLDVPRRVVVADIVELSHCWWEALGKVPTGDIGTLNQVLAALVRAYLRGHGCRMGTMQGYERHQALFAWVATAVVMHTLENNNEVLGAAGITDVMEYARRLGASFSSGVLDEADDILRGRR